MKGRIQDRRAKWLRVAFAVTVAITAHLLNGGSAQAATASDMVFAGFTSQHLPAFFKVSSDGRVLLSGGIALQLRCSSGANLVVPDAFGHIPIGANGTLHTSYTPPTTIENGITSSGTDTLKARLGPTHSELGGTWRLEVGFGPAGGQTTQCDSGPVRFTATR
jgi:hypothetical protein